MAVTINKAIPKERLVPIISAHLQLDIHVVKDFAVLPVELLSQCIDAGMPHGVKDVDRTCLFYANTLSILPTGSARTPSPTGYSSSPG